MKILIFEDNEGTYDGVKFILDYRLNGIEILPKDKSDWKAMLTKMGDKEFDEIINENSDIELFIVDIRVNKKEIGFEFLKHLESKNYNSNNYNFILMSNGNIVNYNLKKYTVENVPFVFKRTLSPRFIGEEIFSKIKEMYNLK